MISSTIKIFVDENEFDFIRDAPVPESAFVLNSETSVSRLKTHFFETLSELGEVIKFSRGDAISGGELARAIDSPDTLIAAFHESPPELSCRLLQHTKGGLMLPGGFLGPWTLRESTFNLVETKRQMVQINQSGATWPLNLGVYAQRLAREVFFSNHSRAPSIGRNTDQTALIYAGRFIPNKGLAQLIRGLNLWPLIGCSIKMVGDWEPNFFNSQSGGQCPHFRRWFEREVISRNLVTSLSVIPPVPQECLAQLYEEADAFVYPSFHEDEASGNAPHEAVLSGIPAVVTDWSGLGQLGRATRGGAVPTYPTLGGIRYSLRALREQIKRISQAEHCVVYDEILKDAEWVKETFEPMVMRRSLSSGIMGLLHHSTAPPLPGGWRTAERLEMMIRYGPPVVKDALVVNSSAVINGLYSDGLGYEHHDYSEAHFLTAIQSLYTTWPQPPRLRPGVSLHGFWRIGLWSDERALVEFGFPGPRVLRFSEADWKVVQASARPLGKGDFAFEIFNHRAAEVLQPAVDLGYLVPHDPMACDLPEPNDTIPNIR